MDIKILVATHKEYWMPKDDVYIPLHEGKKGKKDLGYVGDDTGNNISEKNANYCELTGLYWAWKNLSCSYIGICHYRRYFGRKNRANNINNILSKNEFEDILKNNDTILPYKSHFYFQSVEEKYAESHYLKDLNTTRTIIGDIYPQYLSSFEKVMKSHKAYLCNMLVTKKEFFDEYCEWLFNILFELECVIDISQYSDYNKRVFGFISERLLNVWIEYNSLNVKELPIVCLENNNTIKEDINQIRHSLRYKLYKKKSEREWLDYNF